MAIEADLAALEQALASVNAPLSASLAPGRAAEAVDGILTAASLAVPDEVRRYFQWRDGLRGDREADHELFPGGVMLSLEEAVGARGMQREAARVVSLQTGLPASSIWREDWLPLFGHPAGGDFHVTRAAAGAEAPLWLVPNEDRQAAALVFDSLSALVRTVAECWSSGAYRVKDGILEEDRLRAGEIVRRHNPERVRAATSWLETP